MRRRRVRAGGRRAVGMGFARRVYGGRSRRFEHRARAFLGYGPPEVHAPEPRRVGGDDHRLPRRACGSGAHGIRRPRHQPCDRLLYYTGADVLRGGRVSGRSLMGGNPSFSNQRKMFVGKFFSFRQKIWILFKKKLAKRLYMCYNLSEYRKQILFAVAVFQAIVGKSVEK